MSKHQNKAKAPQLVIENEETKTKSGSHERVEEREFVVEEEEQPKEGKKPEVKDYIKRARRSILGVVEELFPGHAHAAICGFAGFITAILLFIIGLWKTLVICFLVIAGVALGQIYDGDPKIINAVKKLIFDNKRS